MKKKLPAAVITAVVFLVIYFISPSDLINQVKNESLPFTGEPAAVEQEKITREVAVEQMTVAEHTGQVTAAAHTGQEESLQAPGEKPPLTERIQNSDCPVKVIDTEGIVPGGFIIAEVVRITDGDTFRAAYKEKEYRVRLLCIDTPESVKENVAEQPYGKQAADKLEEMVLGKKVTLVFEKDIEDDYGRLLAYVLLENGTCVNAFMIAEGFARVNAVKPNIINRDYFNELQEKAIKELKGLWSLPEVERPFVKNKNGVYIPRFYDNAA